MSDADVQEACRQVYAGLRVLERHGERCVLLRRESELGPDHLEEVSAEEAAKRERDMDRLREAFAKLNREDAEYRDLQRRCAELREEIDREVQGGR